MARASQEPFALTSGRLRLSKTHWERSSLLPPAMPRTNSCRPLRSSLLWFRRLKEKGSCDRPVSQRRLPPVPLGLYRWPTLSKLFLCRAAAEVGDRSHEQMHSQLMLVLCWCGSDVYGVTCSMKVQVAIAVQIVSLQGSS